MNLLTLRPTPRGLNYACFTDRLRDPFLASPLQETRGPDEDPPSFASSLQHILAGFEQATGTFMPDGIALATRFGGESFHGPTRLTAAVLKQLRGVSSQAPMDVPVLLDLIRVVHRRCPDVPVVLLFETSFFSALPPRERLYGLDRETARTLHVRRYGYHGLFHEAVCSSVSSARAATGRHAPARVLSVCLEPHPEVSAVIGNRPVTVSSGATPLEGIPGQTSCGELDPGTILILAKEQNWGPEQINSLLTQQSGLLGLAGRPVTVGEVLRSDAPDLALARSVLEYRILQSCGAGMAAMSGVDAVAFSGRYAEAGERLGPWLLDKLSFRGGRPGEKPSSLICRDTIDRVIADQATPAFLEEARSRRAG
jgi:acetate kinase